jgi:tetratricopeptide (TPR) repeat protein
MSSRAEPLPKRLIVGVMAMTLVVLVLGGTVVAMKLRPAETSSIAVDRNVQQWERAVIANPNDTVARTNLGLALLDAGRPGDARDAFEEAIELDDQNWMALLQLGVLTAEDDRARALDLLARSAAAAAQGDRSLALIATGDLLFADGDLNGAKAAYEAAVADLPYIIDSHVGLAKTLEALDDPKGALKEYRAALRFDPENAEITAAISRVRKAIQTDQASGG